MQSAKVQQQLQLQHRQETLIVRRNSIIYGTAIFPDVHQNSRQIYSANHNWNQSSYSAEKSVVASSSQISNRLLAATRFYRIDRLICNEIFDMANQRQIIKLGGRIDIGSKNAALRVNRYWKCNSVHSVSSIRMHTEEARVTSGPAMILNIFCGSGDVFPGVSRRFRIIIFNKLSISGVDTAQTTYLMVRVNSRVCCK
ncbi:Hypothetical_protein [Hexamita inflata]|uniref:Hypothetical_protein n=1 Tax=Hexamita inflata TaxID=28002 RepID=A0AA86UEU1_9EUKA|nr:Hypothetical protein HINF_LOCUS36856 [Hexamita inflata]